MNIAFVNGTSIWSGVKTWMLEFGTVLKRGGDRPYYFAQDERYIAELKKAGHEAFPVAFGIDYNPRTIAYFYRTFRSLKIDVVCANIQKGLRTAGIAARLSGIPVIHRVGLAGDLNGKLDQKLCSRWIVDRIVVPSEILRGEILRDHL